MSATADVETESDAAGVGVANGAEADAAEVVPAEQVPFAQLCDVLERIYKNKKDRQEQDTILTNFFDEIRLTAAQMPGKKNCSLFPIMRLLVPALDRERGAYNLKEASLGRVLVRALALSPQSADARRLTGYRAVGNAPETDFAGVACLVLHNRLPPAPADLTVKDVNDVLDGIAAAQVGGKAQALDEAFGLVLRRLGVLQLKWFLRVVLKELRLGAGHARLLAAAHPDAPELFESCANLLKTCSELEAGATRPLELGVQVFAAVSPMLAERLDVVRAARLPPAAYCVQDKFDGERFQLHMRDGMFEYFSRRGHAYGAHFGRGYDAGQLTPQLRGLFEEDVHSLVLDGEMMGWHKQRGTFGSKGMAFDVKKITANSAFQPCFCVFDILYHNGRSVVDAPLRERAALLSRVLRERRGHLHLATSRPVRDSGDILEALNTAILQQEEGVVVKDLDAPYRANRRNAGWYKLKPEYTEGAMEDLDLVVIGAARASGARGARSFYVACADVEVQGAAPRRWVCVGRVGAGLTHAQHERVCARLQRRWVARETAPPPPELVFGRDAPDFWLLPDHSVVLQVRATELVSAGAGGAGGEGGASHVLRFPRVVALREDKPARDVLTLQEYRALLQDKGPVVKLSTRPVSAQAEADAEAGAGARRKRVARARVVPEHLRTRAKLQQEEPDVQVISTALQGREVCVAGGAGAARRELARLVRAHAGHPVEHVGPRTWCCVLAGGSAVGVLGVGGRDVDVASAGWLRALPAGGGPVAAPAVPQLVRCSRATALAQSRRYDRFGDGYVEPADAASLRACFRRVAAEPALHLTRHEMLALDRKLFGARHPFSFLRDAALHFPAGAGARGVAARMRGARLVAADDPALSHQVVPARWAGVGAGAGRGLVVSERWLDACLQHAMRVDETPYLL